MAISWDWVISTAIIVGLILAIWARITRQTIPELMSQLKEFIADTKEGIQDKAEVIVYD